MKKMYKLCGKAITINYTIISVILQHSEKG